MLEIIRKYIEKNELLTAGQPVIVGLSGGADSVALLSILVRLGYDCHAAHCNFHLRGDEADRDEEFSHLYAKSLSIPFHSVDFDTKKYAAEHHLSIEMAARELRYRWFGNLLEELNAQAIAVAHHQDDQLETVLLNVVRGTGIRGMRGMLPRNGAVVRPLLSVSRDQLVTWLAEEGLSYVTDSSNLSTDYKRNYVRHTIIPAMENLNPSLRESVVRNAGYFADVEKIYDYAILQAKEELMDESLRISISRLLHYPAPETILYELLKPYGYNRFVVHEIRKSLQRESGKIFESPRWILVKDRDFLILSLKKITGEQSYEIGEGALLMEEPLKLSFRKVVLNEEFTLSKDRNIAYFDYDKISFPLIIRKWQNGDWFIPFGMTGRKKLSDYFSDRKYNRVKKEHQWLLCNGKDIIWVVGERTDNRYCIDQNTRYVLIVKFFE